MHTILLLGALVSLAGVVLVSAWVSDDALITLRSIDHFVHGRGLRFNPAERVQAFTHPLWLFVVSPFQLATGEGLWAVVIPSLLCTAGAVFFLLRALGPARQPGWIAVFVLVSSKSFVDYSTSGLENPLTHLLLAAFAWRFFGVSNDGGGSQPVTPRRVGELAGLTALLFLNRMDAVLLVAPAAIWTAWAAWQGGEFRRSVKSALLCAWPALAWLIFAWLYYGSMLPNTAQSKLATGIDRSLLLAQGVRYLGAFADFDPAGVMALAGGLAVGVFGKEARARAWASGAALYVGYVTWIGGDFMVGRFLAAPVLMAAISLGRAACEDDAGWASRFSPVVAVLCLVLAALSPYSPLRASTRDDIVARGLPAHGIVDERLWYYTRTGAFSAHRKAGLVPAAACEGEGQVRVRRVCGGLGRVGFEGCADDHWIDPCGLTDAFLGHRSVPRDATWRIGHFMRALPEGYGRSVAADRSMMDDPLLDAAFEETRLRVRAPLFDPARLGLIISHPFGGSGLAKDEETAD